MLLWQLCTESCYGANPAGEWFVMYEIRFISGPIRVKTLLTDFHNFFQENVSGIHEKQTAFSQYEIWTIEQSVFSPENKSSEKQQWSIIVTSIMFHFPEIHDKCCMIIIQSNNLTEYKECFNFKKQTIYQIRSNFPLYNQLNCPETQTSK